MEILLREKKIKITPQRVELIRILNEFKAVHPSFNVIYKAMNATHPRVSRSTVYENLKLYVELGIIHSFHYNGEIRYEMNLEPHVNLAESSGIIKDIENQDIRKHLKEIERILMEDENIKIKTFLVLVE